MRLEHEFFSLSDDEWVSRLRGVRTRPVARELAIWRLSGLSSSIPAASEALAHAVGSLCLFTVIRYSFSETPMNLSLEERFIGNTYVSTPVSLQYQIFVTDLQLPCSVLFSSFHPVVTRLIFLFFFSSDFCQRKIIFFVIQDKRALFFSLIR